MSNCFHNSWTVPFLENLCGEVVIKRVWSEALDRLFLTTEQNIPLISEAQMFSTQKLTISGVTENQLRTWEQQDVIKAKFIPLYYFLLIE